MSVAAGILGGTALAGGVASGVGANMAAGTQADAANNAARLNAAEGQNALDFQKGQYANSQQELAPIYNTGVDSLQQLKYLLGVPSATPQAGSNYTAGGNTASVPAADPFAQYNGKSFSSLVNSGDPNVSPNKETTASWQQAGVPFKIITSSDGRQVAVRDSVASAPPTPQSSGFNIPNGSFQPNPALGGFGSLNTPFQAPSLDSTSDPGYLARLALGQNAISNSAAARGGLLSSGTTKALDNYTQDYASNEYNNVYNRSFNTFETNQANTYNRLAALAGMAPAAANTSTAAGQNAAGNVTNIDLGTGANVGSNINAAGSARATGYASIGNTISNSLNGLGSNLGLLYLLGGNQGGGQPTAPAGGLV